MALPLFVIVYSLGSYHVLPSRDHVLYRTLNLVHLSSGGNHWRSGSRGVVSRVAVVDQDRSLVRCPWIPASDFRFDATQAHDIHTDMDRGVRNEIWHCSVSMRT